jgi:hypothetical protein
MRTGRRSGVPGLALLVALAPAGAASALTQPGSLGGPAAEVDYYQVTCPDDASGDPVSLVTQVLDAGAVAAPVLSVQTQKASAPPDLDGPRLATNTTDAVDGDASASPAAWVNGGPGTYDVFVSKSAAGADGYVLTVQCMKGQNGGGTAVETSIAPIATGAAIDVPALSPEALLGLGAGLAAIGCARLRRPRAPRGRGA